MMLLLLMLGECKERNVSGSLSVTILRIDNIINTTQAMEAMDPMIIIVFLIVVNDVIALICGRQDLR